MQTLSLLDRICDTVTPVLFFQNVWLIMLTVPTVRIATLVMLEKKMPKFQADDGLSDFIYENHI